MSSPLPKSELGLVHGKPSVLSEAEDPAGQRHDRDVNPDGKDVAGAYATEEHANRFLRAPLSGPIRPLSPDTLSNLSVEEYEQIQPRRSRQSLDFNAALKLPQFKSGWRGRLQAFWIRNKGLAYMLAAQVFGTLMNVTTRLLEVEGNKGKGLHPFQILFARMAITLVLASGYMWYKKTPYFPLGMPEVRWLLVARGFGGFFGVFGMYYSLLYLPLADAVVITFLAPGLACWACSILIKEPFTRKEQVATFVSLIGVLLIARPTSFFSNPGDASPTSGNSDMAPSTNGSSATPPAADASNYENVTPMQRLAAVGIALIGVFGAVVAFTTIRWIGQRAHPLISVNYFAAWCTFVAFVMQLVLPGVGFLLPADLKEWGYLVFLGACGFIMQFLLAAGLSYEKSSRATNMTYTQMLFALTFDKLVFGHDPNWMSIIGSSLILGPAIFVAVQKSNGEPKEVVDSSRGAGDEESQRGLINGIDLEDVEDGRVGRMLVREVQMRTLR